MLPGIAWERFRDQALRNRDNQGSRRSKLIESLRFSFEVDCQPLGEICSKDAEAAGLLVLPGLKYQHEIQLAQVQGEELEPLPSLHRNHQTMVRNGYAPQLLAILRQGDL